MPELLVPSPVTAESAPRVDPSKPAETAAPAKSGQTYYELEQPRPMPEPDKSAKP